MGLLDWLGKYRPTMKESASEYDGPYSTYPELHSSMFAIGYALLFWVALFVWPPAVALVAVQIFRVLYFAHTGRRVDIGGHNLGLPDKYLMQIYDESHYFTPILALLLAVPFFLLEFVYGIAVIERLMGVPAPI